MIARITLTRSPQALIQRMLLLVCHNVRSLPASVIDQASLTRSGYAKVAVLALACVHIFITSTVSQTAYSLPIQLREPALSSEYRVIEGVDRALF